MKYEPFRASCYYHVYNRGNNRETIFKAPENYIYFLKLFEKYMLPIAEVYGYCLLPNHFHIVLRLKDQNGLPEEIREGKMKIYQPISNFFNAYAKAINKRYNRTGSLFQKMLKRIRINDEDYLREVIVYVITNSDHHGYKNYKEYRYNSYIDLITGNNRIAFEKVFELFGGLENLQVQLALKKHKITLNKANDLE